MRSVISILLATMILFFSAGFKLATHFCGDVAVSTTLTTDGVAEGCGMESNNGNDCESDVPQASKKSCCDDSAVSLVIEDDYQLTEKRSTNLNINFVQAFVYVILNHGFDITEEVRFNEYSPPLVQNDILVENQVFLI
ncbi:hypothetical protein OAT71_02305 [Flavobacteriales bacterium]|nr:hypothetical protein [Flavobacteriales bacterium]